MNCLIERPRTPGWRRICCLGPEHFSAQGGHWSWTGVWCDWELACLCISQGAPFLRSRDHLQTLNDGGGVHGRSTPAFGCRWYPAFPAIPAASAACNARKSFSWSSLYSCAWYWPGRAMLYCCCCVSCLACCIISWYPWLVLWSCSVFTWSWVGLSIGVYVSWDRKPSKAVWADMDVDAVWLVPESCSGSMEEARRVRKKD